MSKRALQALATDISYNLNQASSHVRPFTSKAETKIISPVQASTNSSESTPSSQRMPDLSTILASNAVEAKIQTLTLPQYIELSNDICFTHTSLHKAPHQVFEEADPCQIKDYERLEFLGDAVLQFGISDLLTTMYPGLTEGGCTTLRQSLVKNETLCLLSKALGFPQRLQAAPSDLSRLRLNKNVVAAIFESYLGGLRKEHGLTAARNWLDHIYRPLALAAYEAVSVLHKPAEDKMDFMEGDMTPPGGPVGMRDVEELLRTRQATLDREPDKVSKQEEEYGSKETTYDPTSMMGQLNLKRARGESIPQESSSTPIPIPIPHSYSRNQPSPSFTRPQPPPSHTRTQPSPPKREKPRIPIYNGGEEGSQLVTSFVSFMEEWGRGKGREVQWRQGSKTGADHEPSFVYSVIFFDPKNGEQREAMGTGKSWKKAKNSAAHAACDLIGIEYR